MITPKFKNVPECLREIDSWLLWRAVKGHKADGSETILKKPFYANGNPRRGALGTKADRAKLVSFKEAVRVFKEGHWAGIGFATMPDYPLTILDLDGCVDNKGNISEFGQRVIKTGTYVEFSPSGRGLRAVYTGEAICAGKRNSNIESGERVEIYCGSAFVTITGQVVNADTTAPVELPRSIKKILQPVVKSGASGSRLEQAEGDGLIMPIEAAPIPEMTIDHARIVLDKLPETWGEPQSGTWWRVAAALHLQFDGSEEAYTLLDEWSQGLNGYDQEGNRRRWQAGFSHEGGKHGLTTMRNLVHESIKNGGLKVKQETMQKWGLARKVRNVGEDDFTDIDDIEVRKSMLPEYEELEKRANIGYMVEKDAEPIRWLIKDMIPRGTVSFLAGGSGTSKSFFALQLVGRAAAGEDEHTNKDMDKLEFAGLEIQKGGFSTLYFAYEDTKNLLHHRIYDIANFLASEADILDEYNPDFPVESNEPFRQRFQENLEILTAEELDSGDWQFVTRAKRNDEIIVTGLVDYLRGYVERRGIDLLVFDTGSEIHSVDENVANDMVVVMRALRQLAIGANIGVLVLQHVQKDIWKMRLDEINQASIRGSSVLVDKSRNVFLLARIPKDDMSSFGMLNTPEMREKFVVFKHVKGNLGPYIPMRVFEKKANGTLKYRPDIVQNLSTPEEVKAAKNENRTAKFHELCAKCCEWLAKENEGGEYPNATRIRTWGALNGISKDDINLIYVYLQDEGFLVTEKVKGSRRVEKNWKLARAYEHPIQGNGANGANGAHTEDEIAELPSSAWNAGFKH